MRRPAESAPLPAPRPTLAPAPVQPAAALPPTPPPTRTAAAAGYAPRAYSVVREYGGTPDRIPMPTLPPPSRGYWAERPDSGIPAGETRFGAEAGAIDKVASPDAPRDEAPEDDGLSGGPR